MKVTARAVERRNVIGRDPTRRRTAAMWVLIASGLLAAPDNMHAQEHAATQGRWLPREVRFTGMTAAQRAEATAVIDRIEGILRQIPEIASPDGYEIVPVLFGGARQQGTDSRELPAAVIEAQALAARRIDEETAHRDRVFAAFADTRLPAEYRGDDGHVLALPPEFGEAGEKLETFSAATRAELAAFFMRR